MRKREQMCGWVPLGGPGREVGRGNEVLIIRIQLTKLVNNYTFGNQNEKSLRFLQTFGNQDED